MDAPERVLFVGQSADASCYHRIILPATALGCDWCGLDAPPPRMVLGRGAVAFRDNEPDLGSYGVVVVQTPAQEGWLETIPELQAGGTKVLYDIDYHLHSLVGDPELLERIETLMGLCDGVICATPYIAERYAAANANVFVCENGIDFRAHALTRPEHDTVNIGWSGTTLQIDEIAPWLQQIAAMMRVRPVTNFVSIGQRFGDAVAALGAIAPERCLAIPRVLPEQYPAAMTLFDLVFDPAGRLEWRRGRSQLRWLEASARGIPMVGDPRVYPGIEHGVTGFHAADPLTTARTILMLIDDPLLRAAVGSRAREHVAETYSIEADAPQWLRAFEAVAA
jgi:hypothetical protein